MKQIRVLHIVSTLNKVSGVMSVIMNYYFNINREDIQFDFLYFNKGGSTYEEEIKQLGGKTFYIEAPSLIKCSFFISNCRDFFQSNAKRYSIMHYHAISAGVFCLKIAKKNGIENIIIHSHSTKFSTSLIKSFRNKILSNCANKYGNYYFACSREAGEFLFGRSLMYQNKFIIINNAIDCSRFKYSREIRDNIRRDLKFEDKFIVGHVGSFSKPKNHEFILRVFHEIKKEESKAILMLVGSGTLMSHISKQARNLGLESDVLFMGDRNDVSELLQSMDAFLFPSIFEGLGISLIEAQATGLLCFVSEYVPTEAFVTKNINLLSLKESAESWANEIINMKQNYERLDQSIAVRNAGFDIISETKKLENFYISLLIKKEKLD